MSNMRTLISLAAILLVISMLTTCSKDGDTDNNTVMQEIDCFGVYAQIPRKWRNTVQYTDYLYYESDTTGEGIGFERYEADKEEYKEWEKQVIETLEGEEDLEHIELTKEVVDGRTVDRLDYEKHDKATGKKYYCASLRVKLEDDLIDIFYISAEDPHVETFEKIVETIRINERDADGITIY